MDPPRYVELVLFEAGGRRWAADACDVRRIDRRQPDLPSAPVVTGERGDRALVVEGEAGEVQVPIDRLSRFERVDARALRAMPAFAQGLISPALVGAWLSPGEVVLLLDLQALVNEGGAAGHAVPPPKGRGDSSCAK